MQAEGERDTISLISGFYCLHPHKETPNQYENKMYTSVSSQSYTGYSQTILDQIAATIILTQEFKDSTGTGIDTGDIQQVIWQIVCDDPVHVSNKTHLNDNDAAIREKRRAYYQYVLEHAAEVTGKYQMTIWVADDQTYQDILEAKRIEKHEVPSVEKKVMDTNDTNNTGDAATGWQDSADYDIGDSIPYQITATLRDLDDFTSYYLEFVDTMEHLTFKPDTICITIDGADKTADFAINFNEETKELRIKCENVKPLLSDTDDNGSNQVVVYYEATLDEDAIIGHLGNPNEVYLIYSRSTGSADKGITPTDKVTVFTYQVVINKIKEDNHPLTGAAFELLKKNSTGEFVSLGVVGASKVDDEYVIDDDSNTMFRWTGIDDGTYKLVEVVTPIGYNTIEPIEFEVAVTHDHHSEDPKIIKAVCDYEGFSASNASWYDQEIAGQFEANIVNRAGVLLPETGGMGTTVFYLIGCVFVIGAGAILTSRKRTGIGE